MFLSFAAVAHAAPLQPPSDAQRINGGGTFTVTGGAVIVESGTFSSGTATATQLWLAPGVSVKTLTVTGGAIYIYAGGDIGNWSVTGAHIYAQTGADLGTGTLVNAPTHTGQTFAGAASAGAWLYVRPDGWMYSPEHRKWLYMINTWVWSAGAGWETLY